MFVRSSDIPLQVLMINHHHFAIYDHNVAFWVTIWRWCLGFVVWCGAEASYSGKGGRNSLLGHCGIDQVSDQVPTLAVLERVKFSFPMVGADFFFLGGGRILRTGLWDGRDTIWFILLSWNYHYAHDSSAVGANFNLVGTIGLINLLIKQWCSVAR